MKKFIAAFVLGLALVGATVATSHYLADSSVAEAQPGND